MFEFLKDKLTKTDIETQDNETQERLIEALCLVTYADGITKVSEREGLEDILNSIKWKDNFIYQGKFGEIIAKVREALNDETRLNEMISKIKNIEPEKNKFILRLCEKIASIDGKFDSSEKSIIEKLRR